MPLLWPDVATFRARRAGTAPSGGPARFAVPVEKAKAAPARTPPEQSAQALAHLAALFSALVLVSPGIDLVVSGWFAGPSGGFPLADHGPLVALRDLNRLLTPLLLTWLVAALLAQGFGLRHAALPRPHALLFVLVFYAAAPGLLVNGLKTLVGRARPRDVVEFGGTEIFTTAWQASSACLRNCSFPSGEAGSAVGMLAFAFLLPPPGGASPSSSSFPAAAFSLNRIAFGAHFLSDVVLSWLLCGAAMLALRPLFAARAEAIDAAVFGGLMRLGRSTMRGLDRA